MSVIKPRATTTHPLIHDHMSRKPNFLHIHQHLLDIVQTSPSVAKFLRSPQTILKPYHPIINILPQRESLLQALRPVRHRLHEASAPSSIPASSSSTSVLILMIMTQLLRLSSTILLWITSVIPGVFHVYWLTLCSSLRTAAVVVWNGMA